MNPLDTLIVIIVLVSIVAGYRRGFIVGSYDVVVAIVSLLVAAIAYRPISAGLSAALDLQDPVANLAGFVIAYLIVGAPGALLVRPLVRWFRSITGIIPGVHPLDRLLGIAPGVIQGFVVAFVLVLAVGYFPTSTRAGSWLAESRVGLDLYRGGASRVLSAAAVAGFEPSEFFAFTPRQAQRGSHILPFQIHPADLGISVADEAELLDLVNAERRERGLGALVVDPELTAVARLHGIEMFELGYFSHDSPKTGSPFDRLDGHGIEYLSAGENLAFSPDVEQAHRGLMDSPGHRENILEPNYRRVGIGSVVSQDQGTMFVQLFAD